MSNAENGSSFDALELRGAFSQFATGVCVVSGINRSGQAFGMTINSFTSVSMEPALLLWNIQNTSRCFGDFEALDRFCINVLSEQQQDISNHCANEFILSPDWFSEGESGAPVISGALANFECQVWARYPGGDHQIIVGEVTSVATESNLPPLIFHSGKYRQLES